MSYTRDPDHYTRGVGAVQAVDKVLARRRGIARARTDAAAESMRRDRLKAKLMRPALGMVKLPTFGRPGFKESPVVTSGGVVEGGGMIGGGGAVNTGGTFGSGAGGGGVSPTNTAGGTRANTFAISNAAALTGKIGPRIPPAYVGICVDAMGNKIPCPAPAAGGGASWNPGGGIVPPNFPPSGGSGAAGGGATQGGSTTTTDSGTTATTQVGTSTGGGSGGGGGGGSAGASSGGGGGGVVDAGPGGDSDQVVLTPTGPDYQKYAMYAGIGLAAYLVLRELGKGR